MLMNRTTPFMVPVDEENPAIIKDEACAASADIALLFAKKKLVWQQSIF